MLTLIALTALAADWKAPAAPSAHVNDYAHVLSRDTAERLDDTLAQEEAQTSNQVVVVTIPSLGDRDIADVSFDIAQKWKIGQRGKDNGVLFSVAPQEHKMRIEVGKGLEGVLTDLQTHIIQDDIVAPKFRVGDFDGGITAGTHAIVQAIHGEFKAPPHAATQQGGSTALSIIFILVLIVLFFMFPRAGMFLLWSGIGGGRGGFGGGGGFSGGGGSFGGGGSSGSW